MGREPTTFAVRVSLTSPGQGTVTERSRAVLTNAGGLMTQRLVTDMTSPATYQLTHAGKTRPLTEAELQGVEVTAGDVLEVQRVTTLSGSATAEGRFMLVAGPQDQVDFELVAPAQVSASVSVRRRRVEPVSEAGKVVIRWSGPVDSTFALLPAQPPKGFEAQPSLPAPEGVPWLLFSTAKRWDEVLPRVDDSPVSEALFASITRGSTSGPLSTATNGVDRLFKQSATPSGKRLDQLQPGGAISKFERAALIAQVARRLGSKPRVGFLTLDRMFEADPEVPQRAGATDVVFLLSNTTPPLWIFPRFPQTPASNVEMNRLVHFGGEAAETIPSVTARTLAVTTDVDLSKEGSALPVTQSVTLSDLMVDEWVMAGQVAARFEATHGDTDGPAVQVTQTGVVFTTPASKATHRNKKEGVAPLGWKGLENRTLDGDWYPGKSTTVDRFIAQPFSLESATRFRLPKGWKHDATDFDLSAHGLTCSQKVATEGATTIITRRFGFTGRVIAAANVEAAQRLYERCAALPAVVRFTAR